MEKNKEPDNVNKPKRKYTRKVTKPVQDNDIESLLDDALHNYLKNHSQSKNKSLKNIKSIEHLLEQYLNSFILIGYSEDTHQYISLVNAKTEQSADSLSTALNKFIMNNSKPRNNYPPNF